MSTRCMNMDEARDAGELGWWRSLRGPLLRPPVQSSAHWARVAAKNRVAAAWGGGPPSPWAAAVQVAPREDVNPPLG